jgi:hypothetical protein
MIKHFLIITILSSFVLASSVKLNKEDRIKKQIKIEMEKEKRYSVDQTFYQGSEYDLSGLEVNPDSLDLIPELEIQDLDMDSVYD